MAPGPSCPVPAGFNFVADSGSLFLLEFGMTPARRLRLSLTNEVTAMAKGQQKPKTNNKPKLTAKERKQKKKEKVKARTA